MGAAGTLRVGAARGVQVIAVEQRQAVDDAPNVRVVCCQSVADTNVRTINYGGRRVVAVALMTIAATQVGMAASADTHGAGTQSF